MMRRVFGMTLNRATEAAGVSEDQLPKGTPDGFRRNESNRTTPENPKQGQLPKKDGHKKCK